MNSINSPVRCLMSVLLFSVLAQSVLPQTLPAGQTAQGRARVIVLDPGHGGHDTGAAAQGGIHEKDLTLVFARILADTLEPAYSVRLTRADDYQVAPENRTALANHLGADLFISLHTGASLLHNPNGVLIAYGDHRFTLETGDGQDFTDAPRPETPMAAWHATSQEDKEKSRLLAEIIGKKLRGYNRALNIDILGMPLAVLQGASLPSLLLEIGYITNPADLVMLQDPARLSEYAEIIAAGLDAYFTGRADSASP